VKGDWAAQAFACCSGGDEWHPTRSDRDDEEISAPPLAHDSWSRGLCRVVCRSVAGSTAPRRASARRLLLDMKLPTGKGIDLLRAVRQSGASGPAVMIRGTAHRGCGGGHARGRVSILEKPWAATACCGVKNAWKGQPAAGERAPGEMVGGAPR